MLTLTFDLLPLCVTDTLPSPSFLIHPAKFLPTSSPFLPDPVFSHPRAFAFSFLCLIIITLIYAWLVALLPSGLFSKLSFSMKSLLIIPSSFNITHVSYTLFPTLFLFPLNTSSLSNLQLFIYPIYQMEAPRGQGFLLGHCYIPCS